MMKLFGALSILSLTICCKGQNKPAEKMTTISRSGYSLNYPNTWTVDTSRKQGADLFIFSPLENGADKFSENINVVIQDLPSPQSDLQWYKEVTEQQVAQYATDGKILESSIDSTSKGNQYKIVYTFRQGKLNMHITSICLIQKQKAYLATYSSEVDKVDQYKQTGEQVLSSFAVTQ
jgi:hypothetical protein